MATLLISIRPRFVDMIIRGEKKVELRRIKPRLIPGDTVIIYASSPRKELVGSFLVKSLEVAKPKQLWKRVRSSAGLSEADYQDYFSGSDIAVAIGIKDMATLRQPVSLGIIRKRLSRRFNPPQSYRYLDSAQTNRILGKPALSAR